MKKFLLKINISNKSKKYDITIKLAKGYTQAKILSNDWIKKTKSLLLGQNWNKEWNKKNNKSWWKKIISKLREDKLTSSR